MMWGLVAFVMGALLILAGVLFFIGSLLLFAVREKDLEALALIVFCVGLVLFLAGWGCCGIFNPL